MGMTQELLALVTGLAHYLKILIRIALTGALKLEREQNVQEPITSFLDKLHMLAIQGGNPSAKRMMKRANGEVIIPNPSESGNVGTSGVAYGFKSLAPENAGESPFTSAPRDPALAKVNVVNPPSDLCAKCGQMVEEDCIRLGTYQRWHSHCVQCATCGKAAAVPTPKEIAPPRSPDDKDKEKEKETPKVSTARRPPANVQLFVYEVDSMKDTSLFGSVPTVIFCTEHAHSGCRNGFQAVSRLEQYAFLLNVALRRLYVLLKKRGVVQLSPGTSQLLFSFPILTNRQQPLPKAKARGSLRKILIATQVTSIDSSLYIWIASCLQQPVCQSDQRLLRVQRAKWHSLRMSCILNARKISFPRIPSVLRLSKANHHLANSTSLPTLTHTHEFRREPSTPTSRDKSSDRLLQGTIQVS